MTTDDDRGVRSEKGPTPRPAVQAHPPLPFLAKRHQKQPPRQQKIRTTTLPTQPPKQPPRQPKRRPTRRQPPPTRRQKRQPIQQPKKHWQHGAAVSAMAVGPSSRGRPRLPPRMEQQMAHQHCHPRLRILRGYGCLYYPQCRRAGVTKPGRGDGPCGHRSEKVRPACVCCIVRQPTVLPRSSPRCPAAAAPQAADPQPSGSYSVHLNHRTFGWRGSRGDRRGR